MESILQTEDSYDIQDYSWDDELEDQAVDNIFNKLKNGYIFKKEEWQGGIDNLPLITATTTLVDKQKRKPSTKPTKPKKVVSQKSCNPKRKPHTVNEDPKSPFYVDAMTVEELLREVDRRNHEHTSKIQNMLSIERSLMKDEIVDEVLRSLRGDGVNNTPATIKHTDIMQQINKSSWANYGPDLPNILNNINNVSNNPAVGVQVPSKLSLHALNNRC